MFVQLLKSKIHRATVTAGDINYEGSITIDKTLADAAGIFEYELVQVVDIANGARVWTYAIFGAPESGDVVINGAAAHRIKAGDIIIIMAFASLQPDERAAFKPTRVFVDTQNKITKTTIG